MTITEKNEHGEQTSADLRMRIPGQPGSFLKTYFYLFLFKIFFLCVREMERAVCMSGGRGGGRERSRLPAEQGCLIPGPGDHDWSQRQMLNPLSHPDALKI